MKKSAFSLTLAIESEVPEAVIFSIWSANQEIQKFGRFNLLGWGFAVSCGSDFPDGICSEVQSSKEFQNGLIPNLNSVQLLN